MTSEVTYIQSANWATLSGAFTPDDLREIADKIEADHKDFKKKQEE